MQGSRDLMFIEGRGKLFEDQAREGNLALGYRHMTASGFNLGVWAGGDIRNSEIGNTFGQLSGGLEALSADFDARVNWYGPITGPQAGAPGFAGVVLQGNNIFMVGGQEVGLHGVDGEAGVRLPVEMLSIDPSLIEFRLYGGGFYFDHSDALSEVAGGKGRAELRINDVIPALPGSRLTAEYEFSHDDVREARHVVGARLRLPLDPPATPRLASLSAQERRMIDPIERDTDVVTTQSAAEPVEDALTKVDFDRVAYVEGGGDLTLTSAAAGANTLIIAANGVIAGPQQLQGQQTLQGGGSTINVQGQRSGTVAPFTAPGTRPTLFNDTDSSALELLGGSTHVAGLDFVGAGQFSGLFFNAGITGTGILNSFIENVVVSDFGGVGIAFEDGNELTIFDSTVKTVGDVGIAFGDDNRVTLAAITVSDVIFGNGIEFFDRNTVTISDTAVSGVGAIGIAFEDDNVFTINRTQISQVCCAGISFALGNTAQITNTSITDAVHNGIVGDSDNAVTIAGVSISDTGEDAILFNSFNTVSISNTSVANVSFGDGIAFGDFNRVSITGTTVSNVFNDGIAFLDHNRISISDTSISGVGEFGISMRDFNTNFTITRTSISDVCCAGIAMETGNSGVISDTSITDSHTLGILLVSDNTVTISNVTISNAGVNGLEIMGPNNAVELSNSTFSGTFGTLGFPGFAISIDDAPNDLSGTGNVFNATVGTLCNAIGGQTGQFTFSSPVATCP
jgi:hypothetical protein